MDEREWVLGDYRSVCSRHFNEPFIAQLVRAAAEPGDGEHGCDFCTKPGPTCSIDVVVEAIGAALEAGWDDPGNQGVPHDSGEGGYQGNVLVTYDVLYDELWLEDVVTDDAVRATIVDAFELDQPKVRRGWLSPTMEEHLLWGWNAFKDTVMYERRYVFLLPSPDQQDSSLRDGVAPEEMLASLSELIDGYERIRSLTAGTRLVRGRDHNPGEQVGTAAELGTAPRDRANASRMSPAGIPMFYGAADRDTAVAEIAAHTTSRDKVHRQVTTGEFVLTQDAHVLDLVDLPALPSVFDPEAIDQRFELRFLQAFAKDVSQPVDPDRRDHVVYVPTQVVTEYARHALRGVGNSPVLGLRYRSAQRSQGICYVLFATNEQCQPVSAEGGLLTPRPQLLELDVTSVRTSSLAS